MPIGTVIIFGAERARGIRAAGDGSGDDIAPVLALVFASAEGA
jgi:hypothetical protein